MTNTNPTALFNENKKLKAELAANKLTPLEKEILEKLLNTADHSDWFEDQMPQGCSSLQQVWASIGRIRKKLSLK